MTTSAINETAFDELVVGILQRKNGEGPVSLCCQELCALNSEYKPFVKAQGGFKKLCSRHSDKLEFLHGKDAICGQEVLRTSRPRIAQRGGGEGVRGGRERGGEQQQYMTPFELPLQHQLASVEQLHRPLVLRPVRLKLLVLSCMSHLLHPARTTGPLKLSGFPYKKVWNMKKIHVTLLIFPMYPLSVFPCNMMVDHSRVRVWRCIKLHFQPHATFGL
jgi:hypothetical protein